MSLPPVMPNNENNSGKIRNRTRNRWLWVAVIAIILVLGAEVLASRMLNSVKTEADSAQSDAAQSFEAAPGFLLTDQQGKPTSLSQFRGKVVALTFIDPVCTQLCPLTTHSMVQALKILGPAAASQVQLLGIDANPEKTTVFDVADYTRTHQLQGRWRFLTGSRAQLEKLWREYHVYVAVVNNDIEHTAVVILIDQNGNERSVFSTPMSYADVGDQAQTLAAGIARLLPGHPSVPASQQALPQTEEPPNPIATVNLTPLVAKTTVGSTRPTVALGTAHPHLVLFFGGWLGQDVNLSKSLAPLDSYAALAQRQGWPSPVAVDVLPTESSPAEARKELDPIAARLQTPIVEDASGRLADNYHVDDLPWFVLSSNSGKILWHHDGWLSSAELNKQVRAALAGS